MVCSRSKEVGYRNFVSLMFTELNYTFFFVHLERTFWKCALYFCHVCPHVTMYKCWTFFRTFLYYELLRDDVHKFHCCLRSDKYNRNFSCKLMLVIAGNSSVTGYILNRHKHVFNTICRQQNNGQFLPNTFLSSSFSNFEIINPLNPELNPICYLLALLWAHHFLHVSRIRVKLLTFRLLMS